MDEREKARLELAARSMTEIVQRVGSGRLDPTHDIPEIAAAVQEVITILLSLQSK